jgi:DNA-directed RNA polymerase subunit RPC12/RpoP
MCFRPATAGAAEDRCPMCDKPIASINGITPIRCPFCKELMVVNCPECGIKNPVSEKSCGKCGAQLPEHPAQLKKASGPPAPSAPSAPATPATPGAPKPPATPSAPKAPGGPRISS